MGHIGRLVVVAAVLIGVWYLGSPIVAGHFGYGTRWPSRVPSVLSFNGRDYNTPSKCLAKAKTPFGVHRPYQIGSTPIILGADAPILVPNPWRASDPAPVIITVEPHHGCFVVYSLEGGP